MAAGDDRPVIIQPTRQLPVQLRPQADTTPIIITRNAQPVTQQPTSRPVRIIQNTPAVDTSKTRLASINRVIMGTLSAWLDSNFEVTGEELAKSFIDEDAYHKGLNLLKRSHLDAMTRDHYGK